MRKKIMILLVVVMCIGLSFAGCIQRKSETKKPDLPIPPNLPLLTPLEGSSLELKDSVENDIKLVVKYDTGKYNLETWKITDSKSVRISAIVKGVPEDAEVLMEHVHIDMSLMSTHPQLDGLAQDSMDNSYHGTSQDGFFVTSEYPYECNFAVEGFSKDVIEGWGTICGDYGAMTISERRLTEDNIVKYGGVYANKLQIVYSLIIKYKGEEKYHKKDIIQEFAIRVLNTDSIER